MTLGLSSANSQYLPVMDGGSGPIRMSPPAFLQHHAPMAIQSSHESYLPSGSAGHAISPLQLGLHHHGRLDTAICRSHPRRRKLLVRIAIDSPLLMRRYQEIVTNINSETAIPFPLFPRKPVCRVTYNPASWADTSGTIQKSDFVRIRAFGLHRYTIVVGNCGAKKEHASVSTREA